MSTRGKKNVYPYQEWHRRMGMNPEPMGKMMPGENLREKLAGQLMAAMVSNPAVLKLQGGHVDYANTKTALTQIAWAAVVGADILIEHLNFEPGPLRERGEKEESDGGE